MQFKKNLENFIRTLPRIGSRIYLAKISIKLYILELLNDNLKNLTLREKFEDNPIWAWKNFYVQIMKKIRSSKDTSDYYNNLLEEYQLAILESAWAKQIREKIPQEQVLEQVLKTLKQLRKSIKKDLNKDIGGLADEEGKDNSDMVIRQKSVRWAEMLEVRIVQNGEEVTPKRQSFCQKIQKMVLFLFPLKSRTNDLADPMFSAPSETSALLSRCSVRAQQSS